MLRSQKYLGRAGEFVGLDPQGFPEGFRGEDLHVFGNPMSRNFTGDIIPDERWREELDKDLRGLAGR